MTTPSLKHSTGSFFSQRSCSSTHIVALAFVLLCGNMVFNAVNASKGQSYPYSTFLADPKDRFGDFFKVIDALHVVKTWPGDNPYDGMTQVYARPVASLYYLSFAELMLHFGHNDMIYGLLCLFILLSILLVSSFAGNSLLTIGLALISYPVVFAIDRGNFAILVFLLVLMALRAEKVVAATLLIALAGSLKLTPFIFVLPLLVKGPLTLKRTGQIIGLTAAWTVLLNILAILVLRQTFATELPLSSNMNNEYDFYHSFMIAGMRGFGHGSSLYMPLVWIAHELNIHDYFLSHIRPVVVPFITGGLIGICLLLRRDLVKAIQRMLVFSNLVFALCLSFVLFMPVSADYYLIILLLPLLAFPQTRYSPGYCIAYGLLLGAKNFIFLGQVPYGEGIYVSYQAFLNPFLLLTLLFAEFNLVGFMKRETSDVSLSENKLAGLVDRSAGSMAAYLRRNLAASMIVLSLMLVAGFAFVISRKAARESHNHEVGLPVDFDPAVYLRLNPQIEDFWKSQGLHESGQRLLDHAEEHYKSFGAKDGWRYK